MPNAFGSRKKELFPFFMCYAEDNSLCLSRSLFALFTLQKRLRCSFLLWAKKWIREKTRAKHYSAHRANVHSAQECCAVLCNVCCFIGFVERVLFRFGIFLARDLFLFNARRSKIERGTGLQSLVSHSFALSSFRYWIVLYGLRFLSLATFKSMR